MRSFCFSIDAERDYRTDGQLTVRGLAEGLPMFTDLLTSHDIPFDIMGSGEIVEHLPRDLLQKRQDLVALGCHAYSHSPGYLSRMPRRRKEAEIQRATALLRERFGRPPMQFRAPNFSIDGETLEFLGGLGYRIDSSVLPGRYVRRWRLIPLVDHRGAPFNPYRPSSVNFLHPGETPVLEVPVTPNPLASGAPLGLGFLHSEGARVCRTALEKAAGRYVVFLAHSWEMVRWTSADSVRPWVRDASRGKTDLLEELLALLDGWEFLNLDRVGAREGRGGGG